MDELQTGEQALLRLAWGHQGSTDVFYLDHLLECVQNAVEEIVYFEVKLLSVTMYHHTVLVRFSSIKNNVGEEIKVEYEY